MTYILNLFGTGLRYWICEIPAPIFEEMNTIRQNKSVEWENLLFDFDFLKHFGYKHWSELSSQRAQTGFLLDPQNRIEIKQGAKFVARFRSSELDSRETIFPLYNTTRHAFPLQKKIDIHSLLLIQFEKGLIGKYELNTEQLQIERLEFLLTSTPLPEIITGITYDNRPLKFLKDDTLITGTKVLEV